MNRYARQIILPNFGPQTQQKLKTSKVLIVGAGGLGIPVLQYLTAAGIGVIGIADGDTIDISNLQRQVLFYEQDIGYNKATVAYNKLHSLNSEIEFVVYDYNINQQNVFDIVECFDIVVDCTDNFSIRYLLNDVCELLTKPLVFASIFQFEAQLSVFHYGVNPYSLRDIFPNIPISNSVPNCTEAGVIGTITGLIGSIQANEVIKIITNIGTVNSGTLLLVNSLYNTMQNVTISKNSSLIPFTTKDQILNYNYGSFCSHYQYIYSLNELKELLTMDNSILIDVRELEELPKVIEVSCKQIPLSILPSTLQDLKSYNHIVFLCKSGVRSKKAIDITQEVFPSKTIYSIKDGITIFEE
ncbi:MAG: HesA/MoeB/ThiF family protein [Candidatus Kapabacteria bacterium]|nr:HesA/MoeB/ThiF family protein [Candidatus Kapabacteria bacterium]